MARLVVKDLHEPVRVGDKDICMCGLSTNQPFCTGAHKQTTGEDEESTYIYNDEGRHLVEEIHVTRQGCCGGKEDGSCCGGHGHNGDSDHSCSGHCHHE